ncbi:FAD-binding protein [Rhodococcus hoagii]|nr:FAD-binding protein [Prescottella equi]
MTSDARIARVEGGARLDDLMDAAGEHGLAAAVGTVNEVGVTGLTLGGGYGPYLGTIGLAADNIISADVVLADGSLARASADENADLLWALRGGGGNFGVVTSLEIGLSVLPEVLAGVIAFGTTEIREVLTEFDRLLPSVPDELALRPAITSGPDGNPALLMAVQWNGDAREGGAGCRLRRSSERRDVRGTRGHARAGAACPGREFPAGHHYTVRTVSLPGLTPAAIDALEDGERGRTSPFSAVTSITSTVPPLVPDLASHPGYFGSSTSWWR